MKEPLLYKILKPILTIFIFLIFHPKVIGKENLKHEDKMILAGNHTSYFDPVLLIATNKRVVHFLAKIELIKSPFGFIFKNIGIIPVDRKASHNTEATNKAIEYLNDNKLIGIFPESTINRTNDIIMPFKKGAVNMAKKTGAKIVPFAITGKYKILGPSVTITFNTPYEVTSNDLEQETRILEEKISKMILERR